MKYTVLTVAAVSLLAGCHTHHRIENGYTRCNSKGVCTSHIDHHHHDHHRRDTIRPLPSGQQAPVQQHGWGIPYQYVTTLNSNKQLADYASQMSMQLVETLHAFPAGARIAVASFVDLGSELDVTNIVGNQLAESFIHQMQQYGLSVVDYKTTKDIRVTANGDFVFTRDHQRLDTLQMIDYVLSGTMVHTPKGIMVNARVINFRSKVVAASSQQLIPHFVISSLYPAISR